MKSFEDAAASLFDGGWRAEDKKELVEQYELTDEEAEKIIQYLIEYEEEASCLQKYGRL